MVGAGRRSHSSDPSVPGLGVAPSESGESFPPAVPKGGGVESDPATVSRGEAGAPSAEPRSGAFRRVRSSAGSVGSLWAGWCHVPSSRSPVEGSVFFAISASLRRRLHPERHGPARKDQGQNSTILRVAPACITSSECADPAVLPDVPECQNRRHNGSWHQQNQQEPEVAGLCSPPPVHYRPVVPSTSISNCPGAPKTPGGPVSPSCAAGITKTSVPNAGLRPPILDRSRVSSTD